MDIVENTLVRPPVFNYCRPIVFPVVSICLQRTVCQTVGRKISALLYGCACAILLPPPYMTTETSALGVRFVGSKCSPAWWLEIHRCYFADLTDMTRSIVQLTCHCGCSPALSSCSQLLPAFIIEVMQLHSWHGEQDLKVNLEYLVLLSHSASSGGTTRSCACTRNQPPSIFDGNNTKRPDRWQS